MVNQHPDSAIALLAQLHDSIVQEPRSTQMYYRLLSIKAKDKAYITHTSDSAILPVLHYYESRQDKKHLPEAYYYGGRVYSDLGDAPQALEYYQKAAEALEGSTDYRLLRVIYGQMGELFLFQEVYEEAMKAYRRSYLYNKLIKNERSMIIDLCDIGTTWMALGNVDSTLYYYETAQQQAEASKSEELTNMMQYRLLDLYTQRKQYDEAEKVLNTLVASTQKKEVEQCATIAALYYKTGRLDSASRYYNIMLDSENIYALQAAHWKLAEIAQKKSDNQSSLHHIRKYNELADSIKAMTDSESIRKMQSFYNYQLREKENSRLKVQSAQQRFLVVSSLLALCVLVFIFSTYFFINKQKKLQLQNSLKEMKRLKEEQYQRSCLFIEENKQKIKELEKELQTSHTDYDAMHKLLLAQKEQILRMNCKIEADQKEQALAEIAFRQSDIYCKFHDAAKSHTDVESKDWEILRTELDHCYKDFTTRLRAIYPISDIEMKICLLLKIKIHVTDIASLVGRSKSTIVSARRNLYEKTHGEKGKPEQWDNLILAL